jgi:hypothetical protein
LQNKLNSDYEDAVNEDIEIDLWGEYNGKNHWNDCSKKFCL